MYVIALYPLSALLIYIRLRSATLRNRATDGVLGGKESGSGLDLYYCAVC